MATACDGRRVAIRCVYTDMDGTLLGRDGSLFHDADGAWTSLPARALEMCDRAYLLENGRIVTHGTAAEMLGNPDIRKAYLGG